MSKLLREREVSDTLQVSVDSLRRWRREGRGPQWCKIGPQSVRYPQEKLEAFIAAGARGAQERPAIRA